jgi:hypothetical protein
LLEVEIILGCWFRTEGANDFSWISALISLLSMQYEIKGRYYDFDGKVFGEASETLAIQKFRGAQRIESLSCFHSDEQIRHSIARKEILLQFLTRLDVTIEDEWINRFGEICLNGRQVRKALE